MGAQHPTAVSWVFKAASWGLPAQNSKPPALKTRSCWHRAARADRDPHALTGAFPGGGHIGKHNPYLFARAHIADHRGSDFKAVAQGRGLHVDNSLPVFLREAADMLPTDVLERLHAHLELALQGRGSWVSPVERPRRRHPARASRPVHLPLPLG